MLALLIWQAALAAPGDVHELWVSAETPEQRAVLQALPLGFAEGSEGPWLRMDTDAEGMRALKHSGLSWRYADRRLLPPADYHQPDEMVAALEALADGHPERVTLVELGWSVEDRPIVGVRISNTAQARRQWRIAGAHHGDETVSAELSLALAQSLARAEEPAVDSMLWDTAVWVIPHINPDGIAALSRYNANRVDLNRNYGYAWSPTEFRPGSGPFSEPETRSLRALSAWEPFGAGFSIHSGATNLGWVWNYTLTPAPDAEVAEALASAYEEGCSQGGFYITNGAEWYITNGDTTDWSYGRHGTLDYTLEVSSVKNPAGTAMTAAVEAHVSPTLNALSWPWWIDGQVVDSETGRGIPAVVTIEAAGQPIHTGPQGYFSHPTSDSPVSLHITAPGHDAVTTTIDPADATPAFVELSSSGVLDAGPTPAHLERDGDGRFSLAVETTDVVLSRPGEAAVHATWDEDAWSVDLSELSPGPWSLITDAGVMPRSLFIGALDERVRVDHIAQLGPQRWVLTGEGFGHGTRAWAIWGEDRALMPVKVDALTEDRFEIHHEDLAAVGGRVDLVVLSNARQISLTDIKRTDTEDTAAPEDTGVGEDSGQPARGVGSSDDTGALSDTAVPGDSKPKLTSCACSTSPGYPAPWLLVTLMPWLSRRRHS